MQLGLAGHTALVTGGGSGIGAAIALELAGEGCDVAVVDRDGAAAIAVAHQVEALGRRGLARAADVSDFALAQTVVREIADEFGRLDILVCSAGITDDDPEAEQFRALEVRARLNVLVMQEIHDARRFVGAEEQDTPIVGAAAVPVARGRPRRVA